ncbi:hypothetical protein CR513_30667, partial [Mucuna pruriens]
MVTMFINTLPSPFHDKVVGSVASSFTDLVTVGERIESGIKRGSLPKLTIALALPRRWAKKRKRERLMLSY